jgi:sulfotransferase 6B1
MFLFRTIFFKFQKKISGVPAKKIFIVSIQKSGTHLIKKIMKEAGFEGIGIGEDAKMRDFRGLKDNQFLWSHFAPSDEIQMALEKDDDSVYIIFNFRDPRDVLVSWFYWLHPNKHKNMHLHQEYMKKVYRNFTDDELITIFIRNDKFRKVEYNPIEHFRLSRVLYFHPKVLNIRFENIIGSKGGGNDGLQKKTIEAIFGYIERKKNDVDIDKIARSAFDPESDTFRKGKIGGYKNILSIEHIKLFNELHGDIIQQYGYKLDIA